MSESAYVLGGRGETLMDSWVSEFGQMAKQAVKDTVELFYHFVVCVGQLLAKLVWDVGLTISKSIFGFGPEGAGDAGPA